MEYTIFHGSDHVIKTPQFRKGKTYNDYGQGFYCTEDLSMAQERAVGPDKSGYANKYRIDCNGLSILNLNDEPYTMLHWLTILLENREFETSSPLAAEAKEYLSEHFHLDASDYDIIIGYRADDSYFAFASDFINGTISYRQLCNAMRLGKLGQQFVIKSRRAFSRLRFAGAIEADCNLWYEKKNSRDKSAREQYFDIERNRRKKGDLYITTILDEEVTGDDARIR